ncbi:hypothetical protein [Paractinoplanes globisporus]|uniref:Uncharacterized protein n=1 Tax=Paractinoplanes globisporus TaxID=113565 RepID=A0ABW6WTI2_9ACTN|nr:hypothetical protein [Actinoplanes globisporus]
MAAPTVTPTSASSRPSVEVVALSCEPSAAGSGVRAGGGISAAGGREADASDAADGTAVGSTTYGTRRAWRRPHPPRI